LTASTQFTVTGSGTTTVTENLTTTATLSNMVYKAAPTFNWYLICGNGTNSIGSSTHTIYVIWGSPGSGPTVKRLDWACNSATGANSITSAAQEFRDVVASVPGYLPTSSMVHDVNAWHFLDRGVPGDCYTLANLCGTGLNMLGIPATPSAAWPTADGTTGWPAVSASTCTAPALTNFPYSGATFAAWLVYPGNHYEGFFTVSDPSIEAYTVYTPGGPFTNQTYYYLQVLQYADGVGGDQFWAWQSDQTNGTVIVHQDAAVPGQPHIPVPPVP
jgi:hypothetical protein